MITYKIKAVLPDISVKVFSDDTEVLFYILNKNKAEELATDLTDLRDAILVNFQED